MRWEEYTAYRDVWTPRMQQACAADLLDDVRRQITQLDELRADLIADLGRLGAGLRETSRLSGLSTTAVTRIIREAEAAAENSSGSDA